MQPEGTQQGGGLSGQQAAKLFYDIVGTIKRMHPSASISWDVSPWLTESEMRSYWALFRDSHSMIDFLHTSGGGASANSDGRILPNHSITYRFMRELTGKPIIADTGYGVNGVFDRKSNFIRDLFIY